jgi:hypothetical protein
VGGRPYLLLDASGWCISNLWIIAHTHAFACKTIFTIAEESKRQIVEPIPARFTFTSEWWFAPHNVHPRLEVPKGFLRFAEISDGHTIRACHARCCIKIATCGWLGLDALKLRTWRHDAFDEGRHTFLIVRASVGVVAIDWVTCLILFVVLFIFLARCWGGRSLV